MIPQLNKLDQTNLSFIDYLASNLRSAKMSSSIALAKAIADELDLPATRLTPNVNRGPLDTSIATSILSDYRNRHKVSVYNKLCILNEYVPIKIEDTEDLVFRFYKGRYFVLYPQGMILCDGRPICDFFNISMGVDNETLSIIEREYGDIVGIYRSAKRFFAAIDSTSEE